MVIPTSYKNPTGKNNVLTSINNWLLTNVPTANAADFTYSFLNDRDTTVFPAVDVKEYNFAAKGMGSFGGVLFEAGAQKEGRDNQLMIDINIYDDIREHADAKKHVYQVRDRLVRGLTQAGNSDDITNVVTVPPIAVLDYDNSEAVTGIVAYVPTEEDNHIAENPFPPTPEQLTVYQLQLIVKLYWYEMN